MRKCVNLAPYGVVIACVLWIFAAEAVALPVETVFFYAPGADTRLAQGTDVKSVAVAGSFNGWSKDANQLSLAADGTFSGKIRLNPGRHQYKFVIDGETWLEDVLADPALRQADGFEGFNAGIEVKGLSSAERKQRRGPVKNVPEWARSAVWYQIFPERFRNGDPGNDPKLADILEGDIPGWKIKNWGSDWYDADEWETGKYGGVFQGIFRRRYGGDLQGILDKLDYIQGIGITAIYLNPIFRSPSLHKYDGSSHHHVEETFGPDPAGDRKLLAEARETTDPKTWVWTAADKLFLKLVTEVHRRGMRIIIDGVFNHTGRSHFAFQDILQNGQKSSYIDWYSITRWDDKLKDGFEYKGWFGIHSLPELARDENTLVPPVKQYVFDITRRWLDPDGDGDPADGIDGWRLDVAFCVPHGFWKEWRTYVKSINPEAYITGEVVEPAPDYLEGDEFDALMNYPFAYALTEFFIDRKKRISAAEFDTRLSELRDLYPPEITAVMQNLMASHDVPRLRTLIVNPDMNYRDFGAHFQKSKVENNPDYRVDRGTADDIRTHKLIAAFMLTYPGAPMIYYGDEIGMTGANDPDCRKPMIWDDIVYQDEQAHPKKGRTRPREPNAADTDLLEYYRTLITIRNENPVLQLGRFETVTADDTRPVYAFAREYENLKIFALFNGGTAEEIIRIHTADAEPSQFVDLLNAGAVMNVDQKMLIVTLPPKTAAILKPGR